MRPVLALVISALVVAPSTVFAQQDVPVPPADAKLHFGPLALNPTLSLVNAGIDTNVFNEPTEAGPKRDFTMTFEPKSDWWLRLGPTWLLGNISEGLVYYNQYS